MEGDDVPSATNVVADVVSDVVADVVSDVVADVVVSVLVSEVVNVVGNVVGNEEATQEHVVEQSLRNTIICSIHLQMVQSHILIIKLWTTLKLVHKGQQMQFMIKMLSVVGEEHGEECDEENLREDLQREGIVRF